MSPGGTSDAQSERAKKQWEFVEMLKRLETREDLGALAALRRGLGRAPGEASEMYPYVVPYLPPAKHDEDAYFLIAALFAWHRRDWQTSDNETDRCFGASYRKLWDETESDSTERRFVALLNARSEDLPEHLRHAVGLLKSKEIAINWLELLRDVLRWDSESRIVQRKWARAFWRGQAVAAAVASTGNEAE